MDEDAVCISDEMLDQAWRSDNAERKEEREEDGTRTRKEGEVKPAGTERAASENWVEAYWQRDIIFRRKE